MTIIIDIMQHQQMGARDASWSLKFHIQIFLISTLTQISTSKFSKMLIIEEKIVPWKTNSVNPANWPSECGSTH